MSLWGKAPIFVLGILCVGIGMADTLDQLDEESANQAYFPHSSMAFKCERFLLMHHGPNLQVRRYAATQDPTAPTFLLAVQDQNTYQYLARLKDGEVVADKNFPLAQTKLPLRLARKNAWLLISARCLTPAVINAVEPHQRKVYAAVGTSEMQKLFRRMKQTYFRMKRQQFLIKSLDGIPFTFATIAAGLLGLSYQDVTPVLPPILLLASGSALSYVGQKDRHAALAKLEDIIIKGLKELTTYQYEHHGHIFHVIVAVQNEQQLEELEAFMSTLGLVRQVWTEEDEPPK